MLIASDSLFYASGNLVRNAHLRLDEGYLQKLMRSEKARFLFLHQNRNLLEIGDNFVRAIALTFQDAEPFTRGQNPWAYLGGDGGYDYFVFDLSNAAEDEIYVKLEVRASFDDLRRAGPLDDREEAARCAYARGLMFWHQRHQFCGACGCQTVMAQGGHVRVCTNPACGLEHFPRTDPAVIMLVHDGERCLLAHNKRLKEKMYSTLAGFVEPGETLEQAVRREVMEEAGIKIGEVRYAGSQPWPFPTSLMVGYYAMAESFDIHLDDDELSDARWFSRDDVRNFKNLGLFLPSRDSIARSMIERWADL